MNLAMPRFFARHCFLIGSILGLVLLSIGFTVWREVIFHTPLDASIELSPAGRVEQDIQVGMDAWHQINIIFTSISQSNEEAKRLIGGLRFSSSQICDSGNCDIAVPIRWSLADASGQIIHSAETDTHGMNAWSATMFWRNVGKSIYLRRGSYYFRAEIMRDVPEFEGIATRLSLAQGSGKPLTWQGDVAFVGSGLLFYVISPLVTLLLIILLKLRISENRRLH